MAACPSYASSPHAAQADERDREFLRIGQVARHLVGLLSCGQPEILRAVFGEVEWVLDEDDDDARSLVVDGLIDELINPDLYLDTANEPGDFVPWPGPLARQLPSVRPLL